MSEGRRHAFAEVSIPEAYERFVMRQLFEPWALELLQRATVPSGASVLDVASGPGTVARLAAARAGESGRVVACDISAAMLAVAAARPVERGSAPIDYRECSADALDAADESFQLALCQNGLQFFPDRPAALQEMRRALERQGILLVSTWAAEHPLGLFGPIAETMRDCGIPEPYPRAFEPQSYALGADELSDLLHTAGFRDVSAETVEKECAWDTLEEILGTISGTPFGPLVATLGAAEQQRIRHTLLERLEVPADGAVTIRTASNIARGVK